LAQPISDDEILKKIKYIRESFVVSEQNLIEKFRWTKDDSRLVLYVKGVRTLKIKVKTPSRNVGFKSSIPIVSGRITKINDDPKSIDFPKPNKEWIESTHLPEEEKEVEMELKIEHKSPFDKNLELQISFNGAYDYEFEAYIEDHLLISRSGNAATQDQAIRKHLSESIVIPANSLFISL